MFFFIKKYVWIQLPEGLNENQFEEVVYFLKFPEIAGTLFFINLWRTNNTKTEIWSKERSIGCS